MQPLAGHRHPILLRRMDCTNRFAQVFVMCVTMASHRRPILLRKTTCANMTSQTVCYTNQVCILCKIKQKENGIEKKYNRKWNLTKGNFYSITRLVEHILPKVFLYFSWLDVYFICISKKERNFCYKQKIKSKIKQILGLMIYLMQNSKMHLLTQVHKSQSQGMQMFVHFYAFF